MHIISTSKKLLVEKNPRADLIKSVKIFFGIKVGRLYAKSRIIRKPNKSYEEFIFKGYDQQQPGLSKPGSFKGIRILGKN